MTKNLVGFDWAIKRLLRSKANFAILEGFLSELLKRDVKILEVLESESNQTDGENKSNKVDMLVKLDSKELVLVEVQVDSEVDYFSRMLFGTSKIISEHIHRGEEYDNIKKVYSVNILYFDLGHGEDYIYHGRTTFIGMHKSDRLDLNEKQRRLYQKEYIHQVYPEYYLIKVNQFNDIAKDTLDQWIYFLKNEEIEDSFKAKGLKEAKNKLDELKLTPEERKDYKRHLEDLRYQKSMKKSNRFEGFIEGEKVGIEKGEKIGLKKAAKNMKEAGVSIDIIQNVTGLAEDEIKTL